MKWTRTYDSLLQLYPAQYRTLFGAEMLAVFEKALEERRGQASASFTRFILAEFAGLLAGAGTEWAAKFTRSSSYTRDGCLANVRESALPDDAAEAQIRVNVIINRMVHAIATHQFQKARLYSDQERHEREKLRLLLENYKANE